MALITCENVSFAYEGKPVVENLNLQVDAGDYLCVVGENGSGKSTFVKGILGLLHPYEGSIAFGAGLHKTDIGYLPQRSESQKDFPATVWEVVTSGCRSRHLFLLQGDKDHAKRSLKLLDIQDLAKQSFQELSGGQQQRVLLARALCAAEKMLLLDEPVAGLDPHATRELYQVIKRLHGQGMTILMISHDIEAALEYAKHILHMDHRGSFFGTPAEYRASLQGRAFVEGGRSHA